MTPHTAIGAGLAGAVCAVAWALGFYLRHAWPLVVMAAVPAIVRVAWTMRGLQAQILEAKRPDAFDWLVAGWRGVLMLLVAGLDLAPTLPWWESAWPGTWAWALGGRIGGVADHGWEWAWLAAGVAIAVTLLSGALKWLTTPQRMAKALTMARMRPARARRWADAVGFGVAILITIPLTTLMMYAVVARAGQCLRL